MKAGCWQLPFGVVLPEVANNFFLSVGDGWNANVCQAFQFTLIYNNHIHFRFYVGVSMETRVTLDGGLFKTDINSDGTFEL